MLKQITLLSLALLSANTLAENNQGTVIKNDSSNESSISQSPTLALGGSATNTIVDNDSVASTRYTISKRDGTSVTFAGTCPTTSLFGTASYGQNQIESGRYAESNAYNGAVVAGVIVPIGEVVDDCHETIKIGKRAAKLSFSELLIDSCTTMAKAGLTLEAIIAINEDFEICGRIWDDAVQGYHGKMNQTIVLQSQAIKKLEKDNEQLKARNDVYRAQMDKTIFYK